MTYEKVIAVFDSPAHAQNAARALQSAGFSSADISTVTNETLLGRGVKAAAADAGFWRKLFDSEVEANDARLYSQTVGSGGSVLTLRVPDNQVEKAMSVLNTHTASMAAQSGAAPALRAAAAGAGMGATALASSTGSAASTSGRTAPVPPLRADAPIRTEKGDEVVRLAEEYINVGKQQVRTGVTRIRRFVVEKPVEAQVTLHEEHATVARRAVTDSPAVQDVDWTERTIEVQEVAEQPVISKSARIAEEVVIHKEGSDHVETVKDTVRRQQIDIERTDAGKVSAEASRTGIDPNKPRK
jgi:uncharacterized protein (TIGR02271 family)